MALRASRSFLGLGLGLEEVFVFDSKSENRDRAVEQLRQCQRREHVEQLPKLGRWRRGWGGRSGLGLVPMSSELSSTRSSSPRGVVSSEHG